LKQKAVAGQKIVVGPKKTVQDVVKQLPVKIASKGALRLLEKRGNLENGDVILPIQ
jgi:hypothetical protein